MKLEVIMNILKNGNVKLEELIESIRVVDVPTPRTGDGDYNAAWNEGYNSALDDLCRELTLKLNQAPKTKPRGRNKTAK